MNYTSYQNEFLLDSQTAKLDKDKRLILDKYIIGEKIVDVGSATGIYADYLEKKGYSVTAVDRNFELIKISKSRSRVVGDVEEFPFKNKVFDTALLFDVLEHNNETILKHIIRTTRSRAIITIPRKTDSNLVRNWLIFGHYLDPSHKRIYTKKSAKRLLDQMNLKEISKFGINPIPIKSLFLDVFSDPIIYRKLIRKIVFKLLKPKIFYSNLAIIADVKK